MNTGNNLTFNKNVLKLTRQDLTDFLKKWNNEFYLLDIMDK